jgi:hypothetical protein
LLGAHHILHVSRIRVKGTRKLKEEALDLTAWRIHFGRGYGHVNRAAYGMYELNEWGTNRITLTTMTQSQCQSQYELKTAQHPHSRDDDLL